MRRGQLESGFQWIFVLVAGGAILITFFFAIKSCAERGEGTAQGIASQAVASRLQAAAWQPESASNMTAQRLEVACRAGVLSLTSERAAADVERAPVFLPPVLEGKATLVTMPVAFTRSDSPPLPLGSLLFVMDERTYYVLIEEAGLVQFPFTHDNILHVSDPRDPEELADGIPRSANAVLLITDKGKGYIANADVSDLPSDAVVRGVAIEGGQAFFYERADDAMAPMGDPAPVEHQLLTYGAMLSGDPDVYRCSRQQFLERARILTTIYEERAGELASILPYCSAMLLNGQQLLAAINDDQDYLGALAAKELELAKLQKALQLKSCPVIA